MVNLTVGSLTASKDESVQRLAVVCDAITEANPPACGKNSRDVGQTYSLIEKAGDAGTVSIGWNAFSARDLAITSWADQGLYEMDFGEALGKPEFIGLPYAEADSVCIVLPRRREAAAASVPESVLEVVLMLRRDDMVALEEDITWKSITGETRSKSRGQESKLGSFKLDFASNSSDLHPNKEHN